MRASPIGRETGAQDQMPDWVPEATRQYLSHVATGESLHCIARTYGQSASTVLRRVRRIEALRDDPLIDDALTALAAGTATVSQKETTTKEPTMTAPFPSPILSDESVISREARRILRRLCETDAVLAVAGDMDKAAVLRPGPEGAQTRTAVVDRKVAQAFAVKDWIACSKSGRVALYEITSAGKAALRRLIDEDRRRRHADGFAETASPFQAQHIRFGKVDVTSEDGARRSVRVNVAETPLAAIARRRGPDGQPFLTPDLVQVGEKLREDFERAQMGPRVGQNWERFLTAGTDRGRVQSDGGLAEGPRAARERVSEALEALGPGLADVVLRVCCFLEGLESAERRLGWSARSGKVVLKIGLERLMKHYKDRYGFVPALRA
jgi:hypothetical protein